MPATMHDGGQLDFEIRGEGPHLLLPVNPVPVEGSAADEMRQWGADPALGRSLIDGLTDMVTVVAFDYEGHILAHPKPDSLTPTKVVSDMLAVADAAGAETFAYYGYSWLACVGRQLAIRSDRLSALAMGGFPPRGGPYQEMLAVTTAAHRLALEPQEPAGEVEPGDWSTAEMTMSEHQTRQFVTLYRSLIDSDDSVSLIGIDCPGLAFSGSADQIEYDERWGGVTVDMAGPLREQRDELEAAGWEVRLLDGLDHIGAMQAATVLSVIRPWLSSTLGL